MKAYEDGYARAKAELFPPWRAVRDRCLAELPDLSEREREFLTSLIRWSTLTARQNDWLLAIFRRCPVRIP